jgi:FKBP-type peptidyl-prolyl cis-trans isomerase FklB
MSLQDKLKSMFQATTEEQEKFLQDNAKKEDVVTLPSGLQYLILKNSDGKKPGPTTMVTVHYEGSLVNGKIFDSSYKRGKPATFGVHQVIAGWTEALQLMPVGSKWKLFIPSSLGYGARGAGGSIPPHATLIFEVELLDMR